MSGRSDEETRGLIEKLAADLEPVEPIPAVSRTLANIFGVIGVLGAIVFVFYDLKPELWHRFVTDVTWASVGIGLALAIVGGCLGAFASVIPGREGLTRLGGGLAVLGLLLAVGVAAGATSWSHARLEHPLAQMSCVLRGTVFAVVPAVVAVSLAARGWAGRPDLTVVLALLGAGSVGALLVHLTCPAVDPLHLLSTHTSTPILIVVVLTAALVPFMRRWAR